MTLQTVEKAAETVRLAVLGAFLPDGDCRPEGVSTLVLLGPKEPGFWAEFRGSPEHLDTRPDPLDRWSERVIGDLAKTLNAKAFFPFGGPPYQPFIQWAVESGRAHPSPVGLLVHDTAGLMVSFRGALGFSERFELPQSPPNPCLSCENQPCRTACPVDALRGDFYDVDACKADLERAENDCMSRGCAVRRACPVSQSYGRIEEQSAFHMAAFK